MADDDRSRARPAWLPLAASAIVVPTALAGLTLLWPRPQIEGELSRAGGQALAAAGIPGAVSFTGRDATIVGVSGADAQRAVDAVQAATGVRVATAGNGGVALNPAEPAPPAAASSTAAPPTAATPTAAAPAAQPFGIARDGEDIVLSGVVGSEEQRAQLVAAATAQAGGRTVVDRLTVTPGATPPAGVDATSVGAATAAVAGGPADLAASITADAVTLTGSATDDAARTAAGQAIGAALPGVTVDNQLVVSGGQAAGSGELDAAAKQRLGASIAALLDAAPITFEPDSAALTAQGRATLTKVLALVTAAPGARLQVDGYVATGPGNGLLTAQQLSDRRAAAVRDTLTGGGVPADRVAATGKGEDASPTDRALGRRADITVA